MSPSFLLAIAVCGPVIGAFLLPLLGRLSAGVRNYFSLLLVLISLLCSVALIPGVLQGRVAVFEIPLPWGAGFILAADALAVLMAVVSSGVGAVIVIYSFDYIRHYEHQNEYYSMVVLFLGAMMGLVYSRSLLFLYLFWELTAIASWRLIGFYRTPRDLLRADKAFLVTFFGATLLLVAIVAIYGAYGTFDLAALRGKRLAFALTPLILTGILSKSATLPFHTWLPDAGVAPSPVTALLHAAVLVKIGLYVFARLLLVTFIIDPFWDHLLLAIAASSAVVAAGAALIETDLKRIIAYSTVSQIGFIFLGLGSGTVAGIAGGLLYLLAHGLAKGGLFLSAGVIEQATGTRDVTRLGGLLRTMPVTAVAFLACAFSIMGIPPFLGFYSKYLVIAGALGSGEGVLSAVFLFGALLTILYLFRLFSLVFLGEPKGIPAREGSTLMIASVCVLAVLSLAGGLLVQYPARLVAAIGLEIHGIGP